MKELIFIDVGAHLGEYTIAMKKKYSSAKIYCFEPVPDIYAKLAVKLSKYSDVHLIQKAVDIESGRATFYQANVPETSSLLPFDQSGIKQWIGGSSLRTVSTYQVDKIRLDKFIQEEKLSEIDFIKIDTQGTDLNVVKSLGDTLKNVREIVLEVPVVPFELYWGSSSITTKEAVIEYMKKHDFQLYNVENQSYDQEQNITFRNSAYSQFFNPYVN